MIKSDVDATTTVRKKTKHSGLRTAKNREFHERARWSI
jgi:hypothetical protein